MSNQEWMPFLMISQALKDPLKLPELPSVVWLKSAS